MIMEVAALGRQQSHDHEAAARERAVSWRRAGGDYVSGRRIWHNVWVTTVPRPATPSLARRPWVRPGHAAGPHLARSSPAAELHGRRALAVAVKIKLKRMGKIRAPFYRIIVADARTKRDGRAIEEIGKYHPKVDPSLIEVNSDRAQYWLSVGAQPTDPVRRLLEITGDWQKFKGLPGTEGTLKTAAPKPDKKEAFAAAVAETVKDLKPKSKAAETRATGPKAADAKAGDAKADKGADRSRARRGGSGDKAGGAQDEADKPRSGGKQASPGKAAGDAAAKDTAAKDAAAKDTASKDTAAKAGSGKDAAAKGGASKDAAKGTGGKDAAAAKAGDSSDGEADSPAEPAAVAPAASAGTEDAGQDGGA